MFSYSKLVIGASVISGACLAYIMHGNYKYELGYQEASNKATIEAVKLQENNRKREKELQDAVNQIEQQHAKEVEMLKTEYANLRYTANGLRDKLTAANNRQRESNSVSAGQHYDEAINSLRDVVALCTAKYTELAEYTDTVISDLNALQDWAELVKQSETVHKNNSDK